MLCFISVLQEKCPVFQREFVHYYGKQNSEAELEHPMLKVTLARLRPLLFDADGTGKDTIKVETIHKLASIAQANNLTC
jgi:hypothetical protein